jgi:hypothetical protein
MRDEVALATVGVVLVHVALGWPNSPDVESRWPCAWPGIVRFRVGKRVGTNYRRTGGLF